MYGKFTYIRFIFMVHTKILYIYIYITLYMDPMEKATSDDRCVFDDLKY